MSVFWELRQNRNIRQAQADAADGALQANLVDGHVGRLEARLDELVILCRALWSLVQEQTGLTDEALLQRVQEIGRQEVPAGGQANQGVPCPQCRRPMPRNGRCLYCGATRLPENAFDKVS